MEASTKAFTPEQMVQGMLDNGKEVIILYVKEFYEQLNRVNKNGMHGYFYTWSALEEQNSYILYVLWDIQEEIAIEFTPQHEEIIENLKMPKDLIITALPLNQLIENAENSGLDFFDLSGPAVILKDMIFNDPTVLKN